MLVGRKNKARGSVHSLILIKSIWSAETAMHKGFLVHHWSEAQGFCPIQFGLIHCIQWFHCEVNFTCPDSRNSRLGRAGPDSDRAFEMGKRKSVATKKAWSKLDTSELEVAAQDKNRELLRSADPEHKKVTASPHAMEAARKAARRMEVPWAGFPIDHIGPKMTSRRVCPIRGSRCCGNLACCSKGF
jgi:hypothetical protein